MIDERLKAFPKLRDLTWDGRKSDLRHTCESVSIQVAGPAAAGGWASCSRLQPRWLSTHCGRPKPKPICASLLVRQCTPIKVHMTPALKAALAAISDHLDGRMNADLEPHTPMGPEEVTDALHWLAAANYGGAIYLTRMRNAGVDLVRDDGKDIDRWIVEQVRMGNVARSVRLDYQKKHGMEEED